MDGKQPHVSIYNRAEQDSLNIYHISMINDIFRAIDMKLNTLVASRGGGGGGGGGGQHLFDERRLIETLR